MEHPFSELIFKLDKLLEELADESELAMTRGDLELSKMISETYRQAWQIQNRLMSAPDR